jgi:hypothetical protein
LRRSLTWLLLWLLTACQQPSVRPTDAGGPAAAFVQAFNQQNIPAMLALLHDDVRYMFIQDDQIHTETRGKQQLADYLPGFFNNAPETQSQILHAHQQGPHTVQLEQANWTDQQGQSRSQCSWSVYELKAGLIINIWYHSSFTCPAK